MARIATLFSAAIATLISLVAQNYNVAFLATLAIAVAASAMLPALLLTMYWRRTTAAGVGIGMIVGLVAALAVILLSPTIRPDNPIIPISSPAVISLPISLVTMVLVSLATQPRGAELQAANHLFDRIRVKMVTRVDPGDPDSRHESVRIRA